MSGYEGEKRRKGPYEKSHQNTIDLTHFFFVIVNLVSIMVVSVVYIVEVWNLP